MSVHADQRRRLFLAMRENPDGITSKDFAAAPAIDGGDPIPRVAARIKELREEHTIPMGVVDGQGFAIYRLAPGPEELLEDTSEAPSLASVTELRPRPVVVRDGFMRVGLCLGCLSLRAYPCRCPEGHYIEEMLSGTGAIHDACQRDIEVEVRHAA